MKDNDELKLDIVEKLVREKTYGGYNPQVDTVKNWFKSSDQGRVEDLIRDNTGRKFFRRYAPLWGGFCGKHLRPAV
jgi:hypothetical protein